MGRTEPPLLEILVPLWPRIAGKSMAQHSQPAFFASGVLTLTTDCATWGAELRRLSEEIRAEVNGFLGRSIVRKLRIKTVTQPGLFSPSRSARVTSPPWAPAREQPLDTTPIPDPESASALERSYAKYFHHPRR